jgi:hypothetical protein
LQKSFGARSEAVVGHFFRRRRFQLAAPALCCGLNGTSSSTFSEYSVLPIIARVPGLVKPADRQRKKYAEIFFLQILPPDFV